VETYLGHSYSATTIEEITELQGIIRSIRDGVTNRNDYFGPEAPKKRAPQEEKKDITLDQVLDGEVKHEGSKEGPPPSTPPPAQETSKPSEKESLGPGDERLLEEFKKALLKCNTAVEVQKYMKEVRASQTAMRISQALLGQMANLANDRMRDLLKKEGA
jgi:hypothetical protein